MTFLLDANVLLRLSEAGHKQHAVTTAAVRTLDGRRHTMVLVAQGLYEFWAVATRPVADNGLGMSTAEAAAEMASHQARFALMPDGPGVLPEWQRLVVAYDVKGKPTHDARLVAAMHVHSVAHLLSFNVRDFQRYPTVTVWTPDAVLKSPP